ncbi:MAG: ATP12 family protein [Paracoccaceae bacterium]
MSGWTAKRFWTDATVEQMPDGFVVRLDGRDIRTPGKAPLIMPTRALAEAVREEWAMQGDKIDPTTMPITRTVNSAIDKVAPQRDEVVELIAAYGDADLMCYRATSPAELVRRQSEAWDPLLDWAAETLGARLVPRPGVMHQPQDSAALSRLAALVKEFPDIELAAFHDIVSLSGSLIIGFAVVQSVDHDEGLWISSRIDEIWQEQQWGADADAGVVARQKQSAFLTAAKVLRMARK